MEQHAVHYYDDEARFVDLVSGYLADGLRAGEHAVVIATSPHRHALEAWGLDRLERDPAQVVSGLANNAVCHAGSPFRVLVRRAPDGVRTGVQVAALSEDWGCDRLADGKFTWPDLAIPVA